MMRSFIRKPSPEGTPEDIAVHWIAREQEGRLSSDDAAAFQAWLAADPSHRQAHERAQAAVGAPNRHGAHPEMMVLRQEALAAFKEHRPPPWRHAGMAAAVAGLAVFGAVWMGSQPNTEPGLSPVEAVTRSVAPQLNPNAAIYETEIGERVSVTFPDGSVAMLNTDTLLKVAYTDGERGVRLVRGQALFEVAKNERVPFRVYAGDRRITAVGTTFDVRLEQGKVKVALVEGVVSVATDPRAAPDKAPAAPVQQVVMAAGEVLVAQPASAIVVRSGDAENATTWRTGVVSFRATPLADAVAEVNRYTTTPLTIADPSIGGYRITGVFRTGDPERFARSVTEVLPVRVENSSDGSMSLTAASEKTAAEG